MANDARLIFRGTDEAGTARRAGGSEAVVRAMVTIG
jgi:hypothetical protein